MVSCSPKRVALAGKFAPPRPHKGMGSADVTAIIREHGRFVWRVLRYHGVPERQLDDLSQEVFVVILRRLGEFEGRSSLRTWIYAICRNVASGARRQQRRRPEVLTSAMPETASPPEQARALDHERMRAVVRSALSELAEDTRMVWVLYEIEAMSMADVAQSVGCPQSTAYSRLHAVRKHLCDALRMAGFDDPNIELMEVS